MSPISRNQWKSVLLNTFLAFAASFITVILASNNIDKSALTAAAIAGLMASFKILEKAIKTE